MSLLACCFWWLVFGVLIGWFLSWLFNRPFGRSDVQEIAPAAQAAPMDDLVLIEGIGHKVAGLLRENGIGTYEKLAGTDAKTIWSVVERGGPRFKLANNPGTWPEQAALCVRGDWDGLKRWQDELYAGLRVVHEIPAAVEIDLGEIAGHADSSANDVVNVPLAEARARAVVDHLVSRGVDAERLTARGYGSSRPLVDNATPEGRAQNRRVEIREQ